MRYVMCKLPTLIEPANNIPPRMEIFFFAVLSPPEAGKEKVWGNSCFCFYVCVVYNLNDGDDNV